MYKPYIAYIKQLFVLFMFLSAFHNEFKWQITKHVQWGVFNTGMEKQAFRSFEKKTLCKKKCVYGYFLFT